jgi:hypothetical protein
MAVTKIEITLKPKQVKALQAEFGAAVDAQATMQKFCDDWIVQYERNDDDKAKSKFKQKYDALDAAKQAQVDAILW